MILNLRNYLSFLPGLWKYRQLGSLVTLVLGTLAAVVIMLLPDRYEGSARAYVDTQSILRPLMEGMAVQPDVTQQLRMMSRALLSRSNLERIGESAGVFKEGGTQAEREQAINNLRQKIQFEPAGRENFFTLKYRDKSPEAALSVVRTTLDIFVNSARSNQERDTRQALEFLDEQIAQYEKRLVVAEEALKDFKLRNLEVMPNLQSDYFAQTADAQRSLQTAQLELQQMLNARRAIETQLTGVPESFSSADPRNNGSTMSDTTRRLIEAQERLGDLRMRYTERHPDVQNTARMVRELEAARAAEASAAAQALASGNGSLPGQILIPNKVFQDLKVSLASTDAQVASLRARVADASRRLNEVRQLAKTVPEVEAEYKQLNRDYEVNKTNYEKLVARRESALLSGNLDATSGASDFRVVDPPKVSTEPVWPNRPILLLLALAGSLAAGLFTSLVRAQSKPAFYDVFSLRSATDVPVFGAVSLARRPGESMVTGLRAASFWMLLLAYIGIFLGLAAWQFAGRKKEAAPASQFSSMIEQPGRTNPQQLPSAGAAQSATLGSSPVNSESGSQSL